MGLLGWSPTEFWRATMHDLTAALEGWNVSQGDTSWHDEAMVKSLRAGLEEFKKKKKAEQGG